MKQKMNKLEGFTLSVKFAEKDALLNGTSLEYLANLANLAISAKAPMATISIRPLLAQAKAQAHPLIWMAKAKIMIMDGAELRLTRLEKIIMSCLSDSENSYISYPELLANLGMKGGTDSSPSNLRVIMYRLRKKLGEYANVIETDRQFGYSLRTHDGRLYISR